MAHVRPAADKDIPRILELYDELSIQLSQIEQARNLTPDDARKVFADICADPRHELFVLEDQGEVVGTVVLLIVPNLSHSATPWALVENLVVSEKYRRRGFGRMLLEHSVFRARDKGCHRVELMSDKRREEAHELYGSIGFEASAYGFRLYF